MVYGERRTHRRHGLYLVAGLVGLSACSKDAGKKSPDGSCVEISVPDGGGEEEEPCEGEGYVRIPIPEGSPETLVSIGKRTVTSKGQSAPMLVDGKFYESATWDARADDWVSIEVGGGIRELLLLWTSSNNYDHPEIDYGAPASYRIETSADSNDGRDGTWIPRLTVGNNTVRVRTHRIPFVNQRWLRFVVLSHDGTLNGVQIDEIELHDNSDGKIDGWFFFGDSITAHAFRRQESRTPAFATWLWAADQNHYPMQINGGFGGDTARCIPNSQYPDRPCSLSRLRQALDENDGIRVVALGLGTNDFGDREPYRVAMEALIREVQSRGKIAILPRIPWSSDSDRSETTQEAMNQVVEDLVKKFDLPQGPDLYTHFRKNPDQLLDTLHPNEEGYREMNRLWAEAARKIPKF